jgi:hypothetical protein
LLLASTIVQAPSKLARINRRWKGPPRNINGGPRARGKKEHEQDMHWKKGDREARVEWRHKMIDVRLDGIWIGKKEREKMVVCLA